MGATELRFSVAGVGVALDTPTPAAIEAVAGRYFPYATADSAEPDLVIEIVHEPEFRSGRAADVPAPRFAAASDGGEIALWRADAIGAVSISDDPRQPLRARFRVADPATTETAVRIALSIALPARGGLILHASAVRIGLRAMAFCGDSGAGKTSAVAAVAERDVRAVKLADELLVVRERDGAWFASVAPFHDREPLPHGETVALEAVSVLTRGDETALTRLAAPEALPALSRRVLSYVHDARTAASVLEACGRLASSVPCYRLRFRDPREIPDLLEGA